MEAEAGSGIFVRPDLTVQPTDVRVGQQLEVEAISTSRKVGHESRQTNLAETHVDVYIVIIQPCGEFGELQKGERR